jgi:protein phosphatase 2C
MAEICCEEAKSTPATAVAAASVSAVAVASSALERRRRRLEMRRFRIESDPEAPVAEDVRAAKRQRLLVRTVSGSCPDAGSDSDRPALPEWLPRYGVTSVCGRRREMEDTVSIRPDFLPGTSKQHFFGVFDGHGCSHVRHTRTSRNLNLCAEFCSVC